jgi:hypothetical protein
MPITREDIITTVQKALEPDPNVFAVWLEGADATGNVDDYSDIDLCCSVTPGHMPAATACAHQALQSLGRLDIADIPTAAEDTQYAVFHMEGTSPYLLVDFNVYVGRGSDFTANDWIEKPKILFDRTGVVKFHEPDAQQAAAKRAERLKALQAQAAQSSRIEKYILRGDYLEAFGYYHHWLMEPLIEVLRMRYTPLHPDYYIVHISRHLPADALKRLEYFFQISSLEEIARKTPEAVAWFEETAKFLNL